MTMAQHRFKAARESYSNIDITTRIQDASPHRLVAILYEELLRSLDAMTAAIARGEQQAAGNCQSRALSILHGLRASLDMDKGGEVALNLDAIYGEASRLVVHAGRECDATGVKTVRDMIGEIGSAWAVIG